MLSSFPVIHSRTELTYYRTRKPTLPLVVTVPLPQANTALLLKASMVHHKVVLKVVLKVVMEHLLKVANMAVLLLVPLVTDSSSSSSKVDMVNSREDTEPHQLPPDIRMMGMNTHCSDTGRRAVYCSAQSEAANSY